MGKWLNEAKRIKPYVQRAVQSLPENDALQVKTLYPTWEELVELGSVEADEGYKFLYGEDLYKCINANPTFQSDWVPGIDTASLYTRIDESHAGTFEDPIPYDGNMELFNGVYYTQSNVVYLCTRDTGAPVFHDLSSLVGLYVEVVTE